MRRRHRRRRRSADRSWPGREISCESPNETGAGKHRPPARSTIGTVLLSRERQRLHGNMHLALGLAGEFYLAVDQGEDRMVAAEAHVGAGMPLGAALTDQDVAGNDC